MTCAILASERVGSRSSAESASPSERYTSPALASALGISLACSRFELTSSRASSRRPALAKISASSPRSESGAMKVKARASASAVSISPQSGELVTADRATVRGEGRSAQLCVQLQETPQVAVQGLGELACQGGETPQPLELQRRVVLEIIVGTEELAIQREHRSGNGQRIDQLGALGRKWSAHRGSIAQQPIAL